MFGIHCPRLRAALAATLALCLAGSVYAQAPAKPPEKVFQPAPTIRGVLRSSQLVLDRLKTVLSLTSAEDQKQFETLSTNIELFLVGVDRTKPVRVDVITLKNSTTYRLHVPVLDDKIYEFLEYNIYPLGIPYQQFAKQPNTYRLGFRPNAAFDGFMLYDAAQRGGYATIVEIAELFPFPNGPSPVEGVQKLLARGFDAALRLRNEAEGVEKRHQRYAADKAQVLGELARRPNESALEFELRKFAAGVQFEESERLYAEAKELIVGLAINSDPARGRIEFEIEALPETSLAKSIEILAQEPSRFASIPVPEEATSSGRINFPLDQFRIENFLAMSQKFRKTELSEAEDIEGATPEQVAATKKFLNALFDRLDAGVKAGVIDAFMNMTQNEEGVYTVVGGVVSPEARKWTPVLELATHLKNPPEFHQDVGKVGEIALHEIIFPDGKNPQYVGLFGDRRLVIGIGDNTVWYAAGPEADARLKAAIEAAKKPGNVDSTVVSFHGELLPAFKILDQRRGEKGEPDLRARAIEAFTDDQGQVDLEITREDDTVSGTLNVDAGVLRLIGASLAEFSREHLAY